jgi:starch phosphorylase
MKQENKKRLALWVKTNCNIKIDTNSMFDVMVKRLHEYKRQFMNALWIAHRYLQIKETPPQERKKFVPRTSLIG